MSFDFVQKWNIHMVTAHDFFVVVVVGGWSPVADIWEHGEFAKKKSLSKLWLFFNIYIFVMQLVFITAAHGFQVLQLIEVGVKHVL